MGTLADRVEAECETELSRLGSEKLLLAATEADIEADTVAGVLAATFGVGADRLSAWADEATDDAVAEQLDAAVREYRTLQESTLAEWPDADADPLVDLGDPDDDRERVGAGLVGLPLVLDRLLLQAVSYHVNEANAGAADRLRAFRDDVAAVQERATDVPDGAAADAAVAGAVAVIEAAYDRYAARLDAMGLDPKPLC